MEERMRAQGMFRVVCYDERGMRRWEEMITNLVTYVGKNDMLTQYLKGSAYTAAVYLGLKGSGTVASSHTQSSHSAWAEVGGANNPTYTGNRITIAFGTSSGGVIVSSAHQFSMTSSGWVHGAFINQGGVATKDNSTGVLFCAGDFDQGSKQVDNGWTVEVTYTLTL